MKKFLTLLLAMLILCACEWGPKKANEYNNTRWVAQEADLYFDVGDFYDETLYNTRGKISNNGEDVIIVVLFRFGGIYIVPLGFGEEWNKYGPTEEDAIITGKSYSGTSQSFVFTITDRQPGILDESITELTFIREDIPEE